MSAVHVRLLGAEGGPTIKFHDNKTIARVYQ